MIRGRSSLAVGCLVATTALLMARAAGATTMAAPAPRAGTAVLDYVAGADCPGRDRFFAQVEDALDPSERARVLAAPGTRIRVEIRPAIGGYRGTLEKIDPAGVSAARVVASPICADVAQALALTAAFSLAPAPAAAPTPVVAAVEPPTSRSAPRERSTAGAFPGRWSVAVGPVAGRWLTSGFLTGIEGGVDRTLPFEVAARPFAASLRLRTTYVRNDWMGGTPDARFALWTGTVEACGLARLFGAVLEVGLCGGGESGWLRGRGVRIANPRATDSWWLAFGGGPLARLALGRRWAVEVAGAARRPLRHVEFAFDDPAQTIGETPAVTWTAGLALAARFP